MNVLGSEMSASYKYVQQKKKRTLHFFIISICPNLMQEPIYRYYEYV